MNIVLATGEKESQEIIAFGLEGKFFSQVHRALTPQKAIDILLADASVNLIITDSTSINFPLIKFLINSGSKIPILVVGSQQSLEPFKDLNIVGNLIIKTNVEPLIEKIQELVGNGKVQSGETSSEYCRVKTDLLLKVIPLSCDVFIKLSDIKYVKLFKKGDTFSIQHRDLISVDRKVEYLYLHQNDLGEFMTKLNSELEKVLTTENTPEAVANRLSVSVHEMTGELVARLGFTKDVQDISKQNVRVTLKALGSKPKLAKILTALSLEKERYISSHSVMVANIASAIAIKMKWPSETTMSKLTLAAFCHDLSLVTGGLGSLLFPEDINKIQEKATPDQLNIFKNHPMVSADFVKQFNEIPSDVDIIVAQHHERPNGKGFPRGLTATYISPLSSVFIVAHDMVDHFYNVGRVSGLEEFLKIYGPQYTLGTFKKIVMALNQKDEDE